jgi:diguanylate cyclase (GGDEF)-like protein
LIQSALYRITEKTNTTRDLNELYQAIHEIVGQLMYAKNFYIALYEPLTDSLTFPYFVDEVDKEAPAQAAGTGLTGYVMRTGKPMLITRDSQLELAAANEVGLIGTPSVDWLGVPLKSGETIFGALVVQSYNEESRFNQQDKEVLTFVSQHIATALERKQAEEMIRHHAFHDALTLLPNRLLFRDRFSQALVHAHRTRELVAMMFLDLDRFKNINDTLGHPVGDRVLQEVASRLNQCLREDDTIARLGGDEFMLMLPGLRQIEDAAKVAQKIMLSMKPAFSINGLDLHITTSIGISLFPHDGSDPETLIKNADIALYRAKESGRNNYQMYSPAMNVRALELLALENRLRGALDRKEFVLHYQPQIDTRTGRVIGSEALVRWVGRDGRLILPSEFIPLSEETGIIFSLGEWVLHSACKQNRDWHAQGHPRIPVSVNISGKQFQQPNLYQLISDIIDDTGLPPEYLELELTETMIMQNPARAVETLRALRSRGIRISIDDFGTGYSSLSQLRHFPIEALKIDQSFVRDCVSSFDDAAIVEAIISMAHTLKLRVVAEGVETKEQLDFMRRHGCDIIQGFYFSKAIEPDAFLAFSRQGLGL